MKAKTGKVEVACVETPKRSGTADYYRAAVGAQYRAVCAKTGEFFREVVKFGALLNEVAAFLGEARGNNDEEGLKGWLAANCPEVNYNTARGYKLMAAKCAKMIGGGTQALAALQGRAEVASPGTGETVDVDAQFVERRDALFAAADSRRKLEQMWFDFCAEPRRPGRPKGSVARAAAPDANSPATCARAEWSRVVAVAAKDDAALRAAARLLSQEDVENALTILRTLVDYLKEREAELRRK